MTLDKSDMKPDCICYCLPKEGNYIIGNKYKWEYIIDGICVFDEEENSVCFDECTFLWYFKRG